MLENIRWKMAAKLAKKAHETVELGGFENIKKGLLYFKVSLILVPKTDEVREVGQKLYLMAIEHKQKLENQDRA